MCENANILRDLRTFEPLEGGVRKFCTLIREVSFLPGGGASVCDGRSRIFLPPLCIRKKFCFPLYLTLKILVPPWLCEKF